MDIPDWLWQGLVADAIWTSIAFSGAWAYRHREAILRRLGKRQPVLLSGTLRGESSLDGTLTVGKSVDLRWNVEPPTPSIARRLEELAYWYLHVS
jgi:hypothetical protein